jgi:hypothetical protein
MPPPSSSESHCRSEPRNSRRESSSFGSITNSISFVLPSQFQLNPAGELLAVSLWVVFIALGLYILYTRFLVLPRPWRSLSNSRLEENRLGLPQERRQLELLLELLSDQQLPDRARDLQRCAIKAYLAYRDGTLSREECRKQMIESFFSAAISG